MAVDGVLSAYKLITFSNVEKGNKKVTIIHDHTQLLFQITIRDQRSKAISQSNTTQKAGYNTPGMM